jgi:hypothetical protein
VAKKKKAVVRKKASEVQKPVVEKPPVEEAAPSDFSPEKAKGELRLIAEWLTKRTRQEKLVAVLSGELLRHAEILNSEGLYNGDIANEVLNMWERELEENDPEDSPETQFVRGYCMALARISG